MSEFNPGKYLGKGLLDQETEPYWILTFKDKESGSRMNFFEDNKRFRTKNQALKAYWKFSRCVPGIGLRVDRMPVQND